MTPTNAREERGRAIANANGQVRRLDDSRYQVHSQSQDAWYEVIATELGWTCNCPDAFFRNERCKHQFAVIISRGIRQAVRAQVIIEPVSVSDCEFCHSKNLKRYGVRRNKSGAIQRFVCADCHRTFSVNIGFEKMKHDPKGVVMAMQLYFSGESLRKTSESLKMIGMDVSYRTVLNWISKYVGLMDKYLERIMPNVSDTWRADELFVKFRGNRKYLFAMMDDETRFWIAQEVADSKDKHDASSLFRKSKEAIGRIPNTLITDGLNSYSTSWHKEFEHGDSFSNPRNHIREISLKGTVHNNKMERLNGEVRDRERVMRGLKSTNTPILTGLQIYHNFVRPHEALDGRTPAENAGIRVEGDDKFMTLIQNAQHQRCNRENEGHQ